MTKSKNSQIWFQCNLVTLSAVIDISMVTRSHRRKHVSILCFQEIANYLSIHPFSEPACPVQGHRGLEPIPAIYEQEAGYTLNYQQTKKGWSKFSCGKCPLILAGCFIMVNKVGSAFHHFFFFCFSPLRHVRQL